MTSGAPFARPLPQGRVSAIGNEICIKSASLDEKRQRHADRVNFMLDRDHFARFADAVNSPHITACYTRTLT
jgi:hypothetical protein